MMNAGHISDYELTKDTRQFAYDAHREHYDITYHLCAPNSHPTFPTSTDHTQYYAACYTST